MMKMNCINKLRKLFTHIFFTAVILGYISQPMQAQNKAPKVKKICIDAGHGGKDGGCHGQYSNEKDITLAVALKLEKLIKANMKDVATIQTRSEDIFWTLEERGSIANTNLCDLFISIHVNSTPKRNGTSQGTETFVLGLTRNEDKENAMVEKGEGFTEEEGLLNANDPMTQIIIAQYQQAFLNQSINLGAKIENEFAGQGRISKGVKQKSLGVLANSGMPGVLVEIGFLNNAEEENYLNSEEGQNAVALSIYNGIKAYKVELEAVVPKN